MPRVYSSSSDPIDYCIKHFPKTEEHARQLHGNDGDGPDGRGDCFAYDEDHPSYEFEDYTCHKCGAPLRQKDN